MADQNKPRSPVDETPISPIRPDNERRNSLEQHLQHRPERSELVESTVAFSLKLLHAAEDYKESLI